MQDSNQRSQNAQQPNSSNNNYGRNRTMNFNNLRNNNKNLRKQIYKNSGSSFRKRREPRIGDGDNRNFSRRVNIFTLDSQLTNFASLKTKYRME